jgi:hypothetical protein
MKPLIQYHERQQGRLHRQPLTRQAHWDSLRRSPGSSQIWSRQPVPTSDQVLDESISSLIGGPQRLYAKNGNCFLLRSDRFLNSLWFHSSDSWIFTQGSRFQYLLIQDSSHE